MAFAAEATLKNICDDDDVIYDTQSYELGLQI